MKAKVKLRRVKFNERLMLFVNNETVWGEIWYPEEYLTPFFLFCSALGKGDVNSVLSVLIPRSSNFKFL